MDEAVKSLTISQISDSLTGNPGDSFPREDLDTFAQIILTLGDHVLEDWPTAVQRQSVPEEHLPKDLKLKVFLKQLLPVSLLARLATLRGPILIGDFCSGAGTAVAAAKSLVELVQEITGIQIDVKVAFVVENDVKKMELLLKNFESDVGHFFRDAHDLKEDRTVWVKFCCSVHLYVCITWLFVCLVSFHRINNIFILASVSQIILWSP